METIGLYDEPGLQDPATIARRLLEKAYRLDITLACAECFSGGGIASKLAAADSHRRQFAGGLILNCDQAIGEAVGMDRSLPWRVRRKEAWALVSPWEWWPHAGPFGLGPSALPLPMTAEKPGSMTYLLGTSPKERSLRAHWHSSWIASPAAIVAISDP